MCCCDELIILEECGVLEEPHQLLYVHFTVVIDSVGAARVPGGGQATWGPSTTTSSALIDIMWVPMRWCAEAAILAHLCLRGHPAATIVWTLGGSYR